jgi:hypothetical protein
MIEKRCNICKMVKCISEFAKDNNRLQRRCKTCAKLYTKKYRCMHSLEYRFREWKRGAKERNLPFELKFEDVHLMPLVCYYSGLALTTECNKYTTISLDRLDNTKGYTKDNVVFCCGFINLMKRDLTYNQFILICKMISQNHDNKWTNN